MTPTLSGIHHMTAISGPAQRNHDFYVRFLGLRLVKTTVNFDDPGTYHLYYGDQQGTPGSILTFFPWANLPQGRIGNGQVAVTALAVPEDSLGYWQERAREFGVPCDGPHTRFGETLLLVTDPDGLQLELVAQPENSRFTPWLESPVPPEYAVRGMHAVILHEEGYERTARLLTDLLGLQIVREEANRFRFQMGEGGSSAYVDVVCLPDGRRGMGGVGTVHHVAWRTPDDAQQRAWRQKIAEAGLNVSPVMDRDYFHSIYFREPGGVLFEIATDPPGFTVDEPVEMLGNGLQLPNWLEPQRPAIERVLPGLERYRR